MEQKTTKLYPSAPLENIGLEKRLEKKLKDVKSLNNSINKIKKIITYFRGKNYKSIKKNEKYKRITTILKSFETIAIVATTSNSITLSVTAMVLIAIPKSAATAWGLSIGNEVVNEIVKQKYNKHKKQYPKDQQTKKNFQ